MKNIKGMKVGIPKEYHKDNINPEIKGYLEKTKKWFLDAGADIG